MLISKGRRKPYTFRGITRMKCGRGTCNSRAKFQWTICADNNRYRPLCAECDIELNEMVLNWMGIENAEEMIDRYRTFVLGSPEQD
jgi:hypothetical protein